MAADSGMETCPSPEIADSRKRPLDCDAENGSTKRSHYGTDSNIVFKKMRRFLTGDGTYHLKVLVPGVAAGAIIGKGGETIAQLQKDTGARVKMSKSHDFYPGTTERVCLITGNVEAIMSVMEFIMEKIREKPDLTTKTSVDFESGKATAERDKQVKILVPNSTAGMIIGKAGNYIKQIKEESGSYVQISQKAKDVSLQERCITVIGEKENNRNALLMILAKVADDPQSGTCLNVSYADVSGPVANYNPTGSPYAQTPATTPTYPTAAAAAAAGLNTGIANPQRQQSCISKNTLSYATQSPYSRAVLDLCDSQKAAVSLLNGAGLSLNLNLGAALTAAGQQPTTTASQLLEHIKLSLHSTGFNEPAATEILTAVATLVKYNVLGMGLGGMPSVSYLSAAAANNAALESAQSAAAAAAQAAANVANGTSSNGGVFGPIGTVPNLGSSSPTPRATLDRYEPFDPFRQNSNAAAAAAAAAAINLNNNSFGLGTNQLSLVSKSPSGQAAVDAAAASAAAAAAAAGIKEGKKDIKIAEVIVGAILGPGGRNLVKIQHLSGANIQISKKGVFAPGTRDRIVTITGYPDAIRTANYLIDHQISEEEAKRARHNTITGMIH
ncbi:RNA-binding protein Nova-2 isoform X2 [Trichogramma pretiosum]|uniref:RNA-binding protein Nova-2 isoform X2 n=1 Tax=Trichogramma pretiosum TaxID=7493 RepID=UPI000C71B83B|nr:RNA-binding protein Nova-2 isoform X2 [Trichogramma pretiosum]